MRDPLGYIIDKWDLKHTRMSWVPIMIPNTTRRDLTLLYAELGYRKGAEIGVDMGSNALRINRANPDCLLYCIDLWERYDGLNGGYRLKRDDAYALAKERLDPIENVSIIRKSSMDALEHFEDESLDFVFIDANHELPYVTQDIFFWAQKVKPGGIVSGHDYVTSRRAHKHVQVASAVHGYTEAYGITPWFVVDKAEWPDHPGSFFWVKL